ncbi:hypothetical protein BG011_003122 [Mortierella polycephala]|uniref:Myb-like domain-containing protein n=1 Tax=Mortierella polycephala TaxID=41804 RepID=A0A9P6UAC5_9FUNG|nr:hypothetical protein BG011_003122 [Mortierella polycephala]
MSSRLTSQRRLYSSNITKSTTIETPVIKAPRKPTETRRPSSWTAEVDEQIASLRALNNTWEYISMATGRPTSVCSDRFYTHLDPSLKTWTQSMITRMDQMIENGTPWHEVSAAFNHKIVTCQQIWKTQGKGKLRVKGIISTAQPLTWTPQEIETYWQAWMVHGAKDWASISLMMKTKTETECMNMFKILVMNAIKDAPGWVKLEIFNYLADTNRIARSRMRQKKKQGISSRGSSSTGTIQWTPEDHEALLKAVEEHGLFSGWTTIREQVKPHLTDTEVEAEYYKLSGVAMVSDSTPQEARMRTPAIIGQWTEEEVEKFNTIMMKYSSLSVWTDEAAKRGVKSSNDDYETLFVQPKAAPKRPRKKNPQSLDDSVESPSSKKDGMGWNVDRVARLKRLVGQQKKTERLTGQSMNWSWIAEHIGPGFDASMCITKWQSLPAAATIQLEPPRAWGMEDFELLLDGIRAHGKSWKSIQKNFLPDRTIESIRRKTSNVQEKRKKLTQDQRTIAKLLESGQSVRNASAENLEIISQDPTFTMMGHIEDAFAQFKKLHPNAIHPKGMHSRRRLSKDVDGLDELSKDTDDEDET